MPKRMTPSQRERAAKLLNSGLSNETIGEQLGLSRSTIWRFAKGLGPSGGIGRGDARTVAASEENPPPKAFVRDLSAEARRCLLDFERFVRRYFPREDLYAWQRDAVRFVLGEDHAMILGPPRHGKTHCFSVLMPVWLLCGGGHEAAYYDNPASSLRDVQIMDVARSEDQAQKNFSAVAARLTMTKKLIEDFGRFRSPELPWQESRGALVVDGRQREILSGDYSLVTIGSRSAVLGRGATVIIADDAFTLANSRTENARAETAEWLRSEVFSRLEPGPDSRLWVLGARLPVPAEPYGQLEDLPIDFDDDDDTDAPLGPEEDYGRLFKTRIFSPIVDEATKTLLCPERWTWRRLKQARARAGLATWQAMWLQSRQAAGVGLAQRDWIYGSNGFPGCLDSDRSWGAKEARSIQWHGQDVSVVRVMSLDPSPTKFTGALIMDVPKIPGRVFAPNLLDIQRERMTAPIIMDLLRSWWREYHYRVLIIEAQSADRWLLQTQEFAEFRKETRVRFVHMLTTGSNKLDPDYGKQSLAPDFEQGLIRIPAKDPDSRWKFNIFIREALQEVPTDDLMMAMWFAKWNLPGLFFSEGDSGWPGYPGSGGGPGRPPIGPPPRLTGQSLNKLPWEAAYDALTKRDGQ